jgi:hypothetical protein
VCKKLGRRKSKLVNLFNISLKIKVSFEKKSEKIYVQKNW